MSNINQNFVIDYIRNVTPNNNKYLQEMEEYAEENHVPIIEKEVAQLIKVILKMKKPKKILEVGTAIGYSALLMCDTLDGECEVTTIERNPKMIGLAKDYISASPYKENIEIIEGDALEEIKKLDKEYDLVFIDAAKGHYRKFFDDSLKLLNSKGLVISDNVLFKGMIASDELVNRRNRTIVRRLREYLEYINNLDNYTSAIIPIGDGVALTYKEV